jgi:glycosyltransferase involved in cell wall biosynthesis
MNIVMIVASLPPSQAGGAELQALKLGQELRKKDISVEFLTPSSNHLKGKSKLNGMTVLRLHSFPGRIFAFFSNLKKKQRKLDIKIEYDDQREVTDEITKVVSWPTLVYYHIFFLNCLFYLWPRRSSIDVIHAHTMEWSAIVAMRLGRVLRKPVVIKESTMNGFISLRRFPQGRRLQKLIVQSCSFISMTTEIEKNLRTAGIPEQKIYRIPNGIDITEMEKGLNERPSTPTVLFVGNLYQQPAKGVDLLLKAWCSVNKDYPEARLLIIGDGDTEAYTKFTRGLGIGPSVQFLGKQTDMTKYYRKATLFVLPSRREGMSNALMEAMLNGLPCVATDISGNRDLIEDGISGILVPSKDIDGLAKAIGYLLSHREASIHMGEKARKRILNGFSMSTVGDLYISTYERLIKEHKG